MSNIYWMVSIMERKKEWTTQSEGDNDDNVDDEFKAYNVRQSKAMPAQWTTKRWTTKKKLVT